MKWYLQDNKMGGNEILDLLFFQPKSIQIEPLIFYKTIPPFVSNAKLLNSHWTSWRRLVGNHAYHNLSCIPFQMIDPRKLDVTVQGDDNTQQLFPPSFNDILCLGNKYGIELPTWWWQNCIACQEYSDIVWHRLLVKWHQRFDCFNLGDAHQSCSTFCQQHQMHTLCNISKGY